MKAGDLRPGMVVIMDGELCRCMESVHRTPGNLRAFFQSKLMRLKDGIQKEYRFSATDDIEKANLTTHEMQFLYKEQEQYHFMNTENYEQITMTIGQLRNAGHYLLPNSIIKITFYEENPVGVDLPSSLEFKVIEAEPGMRTATASASYKNAVIETGHTIKVPQFVEVGDIIKINPNTDAYLERGKGK
ncbi:MAG: elongation factor P [Deltaproteobacteria bacterium]|nr:elongation factor P [Deltaproteobacteria bacterium]